MMRIPAVAVPKTRPIRRRCRGSSCAIRMARRWCRHSWPRQGPDAGTKGWRGGARSCPGKSARAPLPLNRVFQARLHEPGRRHQVPLGPVLGSAKRPRPAGRRPIVHRARLSTLEAPHPPPLRAVLHLPPKPARPERLHGLVLGDPGQRPAHPFVRGHGPVAALCHNRRLTPSAWRGCGPSGRFDA